MTISPTGERWKCFGCGEGGDGIDLVRRLNPLIGFLEARTLINGGTIPDRPARPLRPPVRPEPSPRPEAWESFAREVVERAEAALWSDQGDGARAYLHGRGLSDVTIRAARLGVLQEDAYVDGVFPDKPVWVPAGVTIPWFEGTEVVMVNVRRPEGSDPKYMALRGSRRGGVYPSKSIISTGHPLILVEGELEAVLMNQELADLAPVFTLGSAGDRPKPTVLSAMLGANPWFVAGDSDPAGEKSAEGWLSRSNRCRRVRPPAPWKDWTDARRDGLDLREFWSSTLAGRVPAVFTATWLHPDERQDEPGPSLDAAWRAKVARLPHDRWTGWRRRSGEIQAALGHAPTVDEIRDADRQAAAEVLVAHLEAADA